jgi:hypothetical protein
MEKKKERMKGLSVYERPMIPILKMKDGFKLLCGSVVSAGSGSGGGGGGNAKNDIFEFEDESNNEME